MDISRNRAKQKKEHHDLMIAKLDKLVHSEEHIDCKVALAEGSAVYAGTLPTPSASLGFPGWKHTKGSGVEKFNYYFYGNNSNNPYLLKELDNFWAVVTCHTITTTGSLPFLVLYTVPTGVGDAEAWYKSKIAYVIDITAQKLFSGERILIYSGDEPNIYPKLRKIHCSQEVKTGNCLDTETLNLLTVHSDSSAPDSNSITVHNCGWKASEIKMNLQLL